MTGRARIGTCILAVLLSAPAGAAAQTAEALKVAKVVEALAAHAQAGDLRALDSLYAPDSWVRVVEGAGVNHGWADYRDHHLGPELKEMKNLRYRYYDVEPQVRGNVAWASFRYDLATETPRGKIEMEGRGTAILEQRGGRWVVVHLHTSGRRRTP